ncbi:DUF397 domain-containing protein [Streptacidiphilus sp. 4-A2]|nr:DUF397 domain-containing protein [Streptacidiphilus sp. 4-A2]
MSGKATQLPDGWIKSSASGNGAECVKMKKLPTGEVALASTRLEMEPIPYTQAEMRAFLTGVKAGEFDHLID